MNSKRLFYERLATTIRKRFKSLQQTANELNEFAKKRGKETCIKPQNVDMWLKGSIPGVEYARVLEYYMYEMLSAAELVEIMDAEDIIQEHVSANCQG